MELQHGEKQKVKGAESVTPVLHGSVEWRFKNLALSKDQHLTSQKRKNYGQV